MRTSPSTHSVLPSDEQDGAPPSRIDRRAREETLLKALAFRVRHLRDLRGMSRKFFAQASHVSEPHIGRLEGGRGNVSVLVLDRLAAALGVPLESMFSAEPSDAADERALIMEFVRKQPAEELPALRRRLLEHLSAGTGQDRRVAMLGIRGAGKSAVGEALARKLRWTFIELDREIEREARLPLNDIFALYGQTAYRTLERRVLERVLLQHRDLVLATGGGIVTDAHSYELLMRTCHTVWLHARHEIYYQRASTQGDPRITAPTIHRTAMDSIRRTMAARQKLYAAAWLAIDTSDLSIERAVARVAKALKNAGASARAPHSTGGSDRI